DWGLAMLAELDHITAAPDRARFAFGAVRVALFPPHPSRPRGAGPVGLSVRAVIAGAAIHALAPAAGIKACRRLRSPARLHHLLGSGRHMLIVSVADVRGALEAAGVGRYAKLVDVVGGDLSSGFALLRPDGILAARGSARDAYHVVDYLHRLCGPSEPEPAAAALRGEVVVR